MAYDINAMNMYGMTALMMAIINHHEETVQVLLEPKNLMIHRSVPHGGGVREQDGRSRRHDLDILSTCTFNTYYYFVISCDSYSKNL